MTETERLIAKLRRIAALFEGATTDGERVAAGIAMDRIFGRVQAAKRQEAIEYRFTFNNEWSRKLFVALLRRYDIHPYRYYRQRYNTVMARVPVALVDETLWPEYLALDEALREHLNAVAGTVIARAVSGDTSEPDELRELPPAGDGGVAKAA